MPILPSVQVPYMVEVPLVPLDHSRPGLPGSTFHWPWPRHEETQRILTHQAKQQMPFFGLFLLKEEARLMLEHAAVTTTATAPSDEASQRSVRVIQVQHEGTRRRHEQGEGAQSQRAGEPTMDAETESTAGSAASESDSVSVSSAAETDVRESESAASSDPDAAADSSSSSSAPSSSPPHFSPKSSSKYKFRVRADGVSVGSAPSSAAVSSSPSVSQSALGHFHPMGVLAQFRVETLANGSTHLTVYCHRRIRMQSVTATAPFTMVRIEHFDEPSSEQWTGEEAELIEAHLREIQAAMNEMSGMRDVQQRMRLPYTPRVNNPPPGAIADHACAITAATPAQLQTILETVDVRARLSQALALVRHDARIQALQRSIQSRVEANYTAAAHRQHLKEQKKVIDDMLGGGSKNQKEVWLAKFKARLEGKTVPSEAHKVIEEEMDKLAALEPESS